ncbi:hypothetical protein DUNSADRAFT_8408 [Dunaliella salina]|uniref:Uncharacterized protein n=1 Tax=Dunaliella salina TaxID=3046 RepID=A0ABQ7GJR0_DUNSA|nr:hypothetical protein DUNSADRAFT_8408 [Dunaliella salina]|eukprot:KAF5834824.1 hypothetical protein DUNSADRAFT_8408 [Dunaliella salina]
MQVAHAWRALVQRQQPSSVVQALTASSAVQWGSVEQHPGSCALHSSSWASDASTSTSGLGNFLKGKLYQSSFFSKLFPGGMVSKEPEQAKPQQEPPKSEADKANEQIDKMANMTLEGYAQQCQVRCAQDEQGKRLRLPPVPMTHPDFRIFVDFTRVMYLRLKQHGEIISSMTREQIQTIEQKEHKALKDTALLSQIAKQSILPASVGADSGKIGMPSSRGEYLPAEVRDCIKAWLELRRHGRFMQHWVSVRGKDVNASDQELEEGRKEYDVFEAIELHSKMLAGRDRANCVLSRNLGLAGKHTSCSLTGLPWLNCCGGKPFPVAIAKKMMLGNSFEDAQMLVELDDVQRGKRIKTRLPRNHLMPKPEGSPRQTSHDKVLRRGLRNALTPKFEKRSALP